MAVEHCFGQICFIHLDPTLPRLFGFPEFLAGLALMALVWTIADYRYQFRLDVAPIPVRRTTFWVVTSVGGLTLLTDLWRAEAWLVPVGNILTPGLWQALLGGAFLLTFLTWTWIAFLRPPLFSKRNSGNYFGVLYREIIRGGDKRLAVIAEELQSSAAAIVVLAPEVARPDMIWHRSENISQKWGEAEGNANDIILLIADRKFCQILVQHSPVTAASFFWEMLERKKYEIQIKRFAQNFLSAAIENESSFIHSESSVIGRGLLAHHRIISKALFSDLNMFEALDIYPEQPACWKWNSNKWKAYSATLLVTIENNIVEAASRVPPNLNRSMLAIANSPRYGKGIDISEGQFRDGDWVEKFRVASIFIQNVANALVEAELQGVFESMPLRSNIDEFREYGHDKPLIDVVVEMIVTLVEQAALIQSPGHQTRLVQENVVWNNVFRELCDNVGQQVSKSVQRVFYRKLKRGATYPAIREARVFAFFLNVFGLEVEAGSYRRQERALQKIMLAWMRKNYDLLFYKNRNIARACLPDGFSYEAENFLIVRKVEGSGVAYRTCLLIESCVTDEIARAMIGSPRLVR